MEDLMGKHILLGVSGSIAAYKAVDLASKLGKTGAQVNVVLTRNAAKLVQPLTFQTISKNRVVLDAFAETGEWRPTHISLADRADVLVIAPATANVIGKLAHGIADDMLSTVALAVHCPILIAPAMNFHMLENPVVQHNIAILRGYGVEFVDSEYGDLACGYEGKGRLAAPERILERIGQLIGRSRDFEGKSVLITAGPTREALDPIRFISNRSTGKMGYALADAATSRGAEVILVSGPSALSAPKNAKRVDVETAIEMREAVMAHGPKSDVIIMAAAVADYRPQSKSSQKIKKTEPQVELVLERNPDILAELGTKKAAGQILVGFSMETENLVDNAIQKMKKKKTDLMVANDVSQPGAGFGGDTNIVWLITPSGDKKQLPMMPKRRLADIILDEVKNLMLDDKC